MGAVSVPTLHKTANAPDWKSDCSLLGSHVAQGADAALDSLIERLENVPDSRPEQ
jgi:hypothetical protein